MRGPSLNQRGKNVEKGISEAQIMVLGDLKILSGMKSLSKPIFVEFYKLTSLLNSVVCVEIHSICAINATRNSLTNGHA